MKLKKMSIYLFLILILSALSFAETSDDKMISISLVNQDPDPAESGDVMEVRIGIENKGGEAAENFVLEMIPEYPFTMVSGENKIQKVGTIAAYQYDSDMKIVKFKIRVDRDATAGAYELKFKYYTEGFSSQSIQKSISIDVESKESAEVIYIDQIELIPGKITPLKFTINNVGSAPLRDLTFQWENEDDIVLPVGSDNTKYIKYIDIGESADLEFDVIASANADPDLYKLDLTLSYDDPATGEATDITTKAGVYVGGATDFDAAFSGTSNGEYSFAVSNIGSVSASSVTVKIPDQQGWKVSGSNSVIIGNLNEGDYTIASFKLQPKTQRTMQQTSNKATREEMQTMSQDALLKIEIVYTDSRGNRNTLLKEVSVDSSVLRSGMTEDGMPSDFAAMRRARGGPLIQAWNSGKGIFIGIIILVLFVIVYRKYRRERLHNPKYSYLRAIKELLSFKKKKIKK